MLDKIIDIFASILYGSDTFVGPETKSRIIKVMGIIGWGLAIVAIILLINK